MKGGAASRVARASGALIQGLASLPLSALTGSIVGAGAGLILGHGMGWARISAGLGLAAALLFILPAASTPVGFGRFLRWFFCGPFLLQCSVGIGLVCGTLLGRALPPNGAEQLWAYLGGIAAAGLALFVLGLLFDEPLDLRDRPIRRTGEISTFEDVKRRADVFGRIRQGPGPRHKAEATWRSAQGLFVKQAQAARGGFYEKL